jgi:hypothetical protein
MLCFILLCICNQILHVAVWKKCIRDTCNLVSAGFLSRNYNWEKKRKSALYDKYCDIRKKKYFNKYLVEKIQIILLFAESLLFHTTCTKVAANVFLNQLPLKSRLMYILPTFCSNKNSFIFYGFFFCTQQQ